VLVGVTSRAEILSRLRPAAKEPWTVRWLEEHVRDGDVVYDIGANVGPYTLIAAKLGRRVVAIEPAYASFAALCENVIVNGVGEQVAPLAVTLGSRTRLGVFNYSDVESGAGLHSADDAPSLLRGMRVAYRQPVLVYRLDDLVEQFSLERPNHLKLDVDGAELDVLRGAERILSSRELRSLMVEVNEDETDAVVGLLASHGLELRQRHDPTTVHGHWYGLFVRGDAAS
jgi:FkbM family methyltransferase